MALHNKLPGFWAEFWGSRRAGVLDEVPPDQRDGYPSGAWTSAPTIALYWCDGHRTLAEVIHLTERELGPIRFDFTGYFKFLQKHGYIELRDIRQ